MFLFHFSYFLFLWKSSNHKKCIYYYCIRYSTCSPRFLARKKKETGHKRSFLSFFYSVMLFIMLRFCLIVGMDYSARWHTCAYVRMTYNIQPNNKIIYIQTYIYCIYCILLPSQVGSCMSSCRYFISVYLWNGSIGSVVILWCFLPLHKIYLNCCL